MLTRPLLLWALFVLFMGLVLGAMGWASMTVIHLDHENLQARQEAEQEESLRLALWRMDSAVAPLIGRESARPYFAYSSFYPADRAYTRMYNALEPGDVLIPSPLLTPPSDFIQLYFQFNSEGQLSSPQVPSGNIRDLAESEYTTAAEISVFSDRLEALAQIVQRRDLLALLPPTDDPGDAYNRVARLDPIPTTLPASKDKAVGQDRKIAGAALTDSRDEQPSVAELNQQAVNPVSSYYQDRRNDAETIARQNVFNYRSGSWRDNKTTGAIPGSSESISSSGPVTEKAASLEKEVVPEKKAMAANASEPEPAEKRIIEGIMHPVWAGSQLLLVRRVWVGGQEVLQGCQLDWGALQRMLLADIADILPGAVLQPEQNGKRDGHHVLAALPVRLAADMMPFPESDTSSPVRTALVLAWAGVLAAGIAVAFLLQGTVTLSERRGAFVSAVTHELRTPLTTFRMYSEMLAEGMVKDEAKRESYLKRLCSEADRLTHLVENVLSFARLEKGRAVHHLETIDLRILLDQILRRLQDRAEQAGMTCAVQSGKEPVSVPVKADITAVEQILFNLVDNACKYASEGDDSGITMEIVPGPAGVAIRLCDGGPGINPDEVARLFKPFRKSARDAAHSAPGVGLGLALSRRLARDMGGDLTADTAVEKGACFVLRLPRSDR